MRYGIFVSANQKELKDERFAISELINSNTTLRNVFNIFLFENLPAKGKSPVSTYFKQVDNSDIYICIIGNEYGIKGKDGLSATEREFKRFLKTKPKGEVLFFVKGGNKEDLKRDSDTQKLLKTVKDNYIYKRFGNIDELKTQVLSSLVCYIDETGAINKNPFDQIACRESKYSDIDENEVRSFLEVRAVKLKVKIPKIAIKDFLFKTLKVLKKDGGKFFPTNTALLFFGKNPADFIPQSEIRIARYEAIREAVINAIAHRDYYRRGAPVMISIFDDKIEVSSPGGLLPGLNIKKLEGHHESRNKNICEIFHETKDMEKYGTGINKMKTLMKNHGLRSPEYKEEGDFFVVTFYGPGEKILDLVSDIPEERQTDLKKLGLNDRQIEVLRLMVNETKNITIGGYAEKFGVSEKTAIRDIKGLVKSRMVVKVGYKKGVFFKAK
ncbi:MAG: ATP-binding protein [Candidatus Firestonebacteria bacterium]